MCIENLKGIHRLSLKRGREYSKYNSKANTFCTVRIKKVYRGLPPLQTLHSLIYRYKNHSYRSHEKDIFRYIIE